MVRLFFLFYVRVLILIWFSRLMKITARSIVFIRRKSIYSSSCAIVVDRYVMSFLFKCRISMGLEFQNKFIAQLSSAQREGGNQHIEQRTCALTPPPSPSSSPTSSSSKNYTEIKYRWESVPVWPKTKVSGKLRATEAEEMTTRRRKHTNVLEMCLCVSERQRSSK